MSEGADGGTWERKIQDARARAEEELRRIVQYINDDVVPDVRRNGSAALRSAAVELHLLAERMDAGVKPIPPTAPETDSKR